MTVRTRFAPSPTGYLHIGGVRTALFNWLFAKRHGGQYILRIDDTDQERNVEAALRPILDGFRWLGINWDEGPEVGGPYAPYFQSQRGERYQAAVQQLLAKGVAYRDYARPEELKAEREAAEKEGRPIRYSRTWMAQSDADAARFEAEGRQGVVRLMMPTDGVCRIADRILGDVEFPWAGEQDHVIQRADGTPLYNLANVVDDYDFKITHVIRGIEHLANTPRQIFIAQGLGYPLPEYAHIPYVAAPGGKEKMSKRNLAKYLKNAEFKSLFDRGAQIAQQIGLPMGETFNPVIVDFYQQIGFLPDAVVNYLLLLGWSLDDRTEDFTREQMIQSFTLDRVVKAPASFDPQKLLAFQDRHLQRVDVKKKVALVLPYLQRAGLVASPPPCDTGPKLRSIVEAAGDRIKLAGDILDYADFYVADDKLVYDEKAFEKRIAKPAQAAEYLKKFRDALAAAEAWDTAAIESLMQRFIESQGIKIGDIIHAIRVAVTGKAVGFGMYETLAILGKERCLARIDQSLAKATNVKPQ